MISVEICFYAQLRDFFGESLQLAVPPNAAAPQIREALAAKNALAAEWLKVSRLASDDAFLSEDHEVVSGGRYFLLPPSSGG